MRRESRRVSAIAAAVPAWMLLHFYTSIRTFFESWYYTYTNWSWAFLGIWLLGLLALDVWLYFFGGAKLLRGLKWYWALSAGLGTGALLTALEVLQQDWALVPGALCSVLTPLWQILAFAWLVFDKMAGLRGSVLYGTLWSAGVLFCLIHFAYIAWLYRRAEEKGVSFHGHVDPGEGTVE